MATNGERRLQRLYVTLTPKERAILVLRAWKAGREPKRHLLTSRTAAEAAEYNRLIDLLRIASDELTQYLTIVHLCAEQLVVKYAWYLTANLWGLAERSEKQVARAEELSSALRQALVEGIELRWQEFGALEVVLQEITEQFDGEDVLHPDARSLFDGTREQLQLLQQEMTNRLCTCELRPPKPDQVEALRRVTTQERRR